MSFFWVYPLVKRVRLCFPFTMLVFIIAGSIYNSSRKRRLPLEHNFAVQDHLFQVYCHLVTRRLL